MVKMEEKNMPRRGENIYKRKDGRWEARYIYSFKEDGSPRYRFSKCSYEEEHFLLRTALAGTDEAFLQGIYLCKVSLSFQPLYQSYDW